MIDISKLQARAVDVQPGDAFDTGRDAWVVIEVEGEIASGIHVRSNGDMRRTRIRVERLQREFRRLGLAETAAAHRVLRMRSR